MIALLQVFSLVVWGCISGGSWFRKANGVEICLFGESGGTCSFGVAIAFFSVVACIIFLIAGTKDLLRTNFLD